VLISSTLILSSCLNQKILDDVQLATATGFELGEDEDTIIATAVFPVYKPDLTVENKTYTSTSKLSKIIRDKLNRKSPKPFVSGKIEVALYSKELAEKGIFEITDTFRRDPSTGAKMFLAVVEGDLGKSLKIQYGETDNGMFLSDLIEHNIESGILPKTNLHLFTKAYREEGRDPFLPYIKLSDNEVDIKGVALFKEDQFVGSLEWEESYIFMFLIEKFTSDASLSVKLGEDGVFASVFHIDSKRKYEIKHIENDPSITIKIKTNAIIQEYSGDDVTSKVKKQIERSMEEEIEKKGEEMIKKFQDLKIDPLGIGFQVKHRSRNWSKEKWDELYPAIEVKVEAEVKISEAGVIS
jgi:spore germination protein